MFCSHIWASFSDTPPDKGPTVLFRVARKYQMNEMTIYEFQGIELQNVVLNIVDIRWTKGKWVEFSLLRCYTYLVVLFFLINGFLKEHPQILGLNL